ncbi:MAG: phosphonate ABC transporter substrate-binding protein [Phycisphaerales bacterium]|nr:phosphonate ABC transporter substrate-binding protein [Phycisphaerales bacterium]
MMSVKPLAWWTVLICAGLLMVFGAAGTRAVESAAAEAPRTSPAQAEWPDKLVLGLVPSEGSSDVVERFKPMSIHLERVLGVKIETMSSSDYAGMITAMSQKHVDVAYLGPKSYVEAATRAGAVAVAMELDKDGVPGYHGLIVAKKSSGWKTVDDIRGKTFAFTDPNSTSGCLVPMMHFHRDLKVDPKTYFREVRFAGSHQASTLAVSNGSVDAAATNDLDLARVVKSGQVREDDLVILWTSELIPGSPMVVRKDLPISLRAAITGALMMLNDDKAAQERLGNGGFVYASDTSYDVMRYLMSMQAKQAEKK